MKKSKESKKKQRNHKHKKHKRLHSIPADSELEATQRNTSVQPSPTRRCPLHQVKVCFCYWRVNRQLNVFPAPPSFLSFLLIFVALFLRQFRPCSPCSLNSRGPSDQFGLSSVCDPVLVVQLLSSSASPSSSTLYFIAFLPF